MDQYTNPFATAPIDRNRELFLRELVRELSGVLEDTVGLTEAEGFLAKVGNRIGRLMNDEYRAAAGTERLDLHQIAAALVDLKRRIEGGFEVAEIDEDRIVLRNSACPFGEHVLGRSSLCMMTSNVFGRIAADNAGFARVHLDKTIANGDGECLVEVKFSEIGPGRDYYG